MSLGRVAYFREKKKRDRIAEVEAKWGKRDERGRPRQQTPHMRNQYRAAMKRIRLETELLSHGTLSSKDSKQRQFELTLIARDAKMRGDKKAQKRANAARTLLQQEQKEDRRREMHKKMKRNRMWERRGNETGYRPMQKKGGIRAIVNSSMANERSHKVSRSQYLWDAEQAEKNVSN